MPLISPLMPVPNVYYTGRKNRNNMTVDHLVLGEIFRSVF